MSYVGGCEYEVALEGTDASWRVPLGFITEGESVRVQPGDQWPATLEPGPYELRFTVVVLSDWLTTDPPPVLGRFPCSYALEVREEPITAVGIFESDSCRIEVTSGP